jgi:hypothetical protein
MIDLTEVAGVGVERFSVRKPNPPARLDALSKDILALKQKLNAVILAHNYQVAEIQDVIVCGASCLWQRHRTRHHGSGYAGCFSHTPLLVGQAAGPGRHNCAAAMATVRHSLS